MESMQNLILMPNKLAHSRLNLRDDRLTHDGGHASYNKYVGRYLEELRHVSPDVREQRILDTLDVLKQEMRHHTFVPWD